MKHEIISAIENHNLERVEKILNTGLDVNELHYRWAYNYDFSTVTIVQLALFTCDLEIFKYLISRGANPAIETSKKSIYHYIQNFNIKVNGERYYELYNYMKSKEFQHDVITKYPENFFLLKKYKMLNYDVNIEFNHLDVANDLNLL